MNLSKLIFMVILVVTVVASCGPRRYSKGSYVDPSTTTLRSDQFVESDLQHIADALTKALLTDSLIRQASEPPLVMVSLFTNATDEHIDMRSLTNKIRTELAKSKKVRFITEHMRDQLAEEYIYEEGGMVDPEKAKQSGHQLGVDYLLSGHLASIRQPVGRQEIVYYKTTMELTHLETGELAWTDEVELKKVFRKRYIGR